MRFIDLTGQKFGRLTVIECSGRNNGRATWKCKCDCGKEISSGSACLRNGSVKSCGCLKREYIKTINEKRKNSRISDYDIESPLYYIWSSMHYRCNDKNNSRYGKRGISVCDEWKVCSTFVRWSLENGYSEGLTLDRIDNNGNYKPSNCRWTTSEVQANNRNNNVVLFFNGKSLTVSQWAKELGIKHSTLFKRLSKTNWTTERILTQPAVKGGHYHV
jgi:hypothetical protein